MPVCTHVTPLICETWTVTLNLSLVIYTMGTAPFVENLPGTALTQRGGTPLSSLPSECRGTQGVIVRLSWGALEHPGNDLEADSLCESGLEQVWLLPCGTPGGSGRRTPSLGGGYGWRISVRTQETPNR